MTLSRHSATDLGTLAFQAGAGGCRLCRGAGWLPDRSDPANLRPCPLCSPRPRRHGRRPEGVTAGTVVWVGLVAAFHGTAAMILVLLLAALVRGVAG